MSDSTIILKRSFARLFLKTLFWLLIVFLAINLWQRYRDGHWLRIGEIVSFLIPVVLFPLFAWLAFAPRLLAYSKSDFTYATLFSSQLTLPWEELKYYNEVDNVFMLQFENRRTIQIAPMAYSKQQWREFTAFLETNFPEKRATGHYADRMFK